MTKQIRTNRLQLIKYNQLNEFVRKLRAVFPESLRIFGEKPPRTRNGRDSATAP